MPDQQTVLTLGRRLQDEVIAPMKKAFVAKDEIIDLLGIALVSGENIFLHGPPGTAKSALIHDLCKRLHGQSFDYLLTRFTEPNELFGPFDIRRLREGDLVTNTEGMLPEASLVFLDELLNANSAILNSLLTALNERIFRRGRESRSLPVVSFIGASNHLPEDDALRALFDRFILRVRSDNVPGERLGEVLTAGWALQHRETVDSTMSFDDLRELHRLHPSVRLRGHEASSGSHNKDTCLGPNGQRSQGCATTTKNRRQRSSLRTTRSARLRSVGAQAYLGYGRAAGTSAWNRPKLYRLPFQEPCR